MQFSRPVPRPSSGDDYSFGCRFDDRKGFAGTRFRACQEIRMVLVWSGCGECWRSYGSKYDLRRVASKSSGVNHGLWPNARYMTRSTSGKGVRSDVDFPHQQGDWATARTGLSSLRLKQRFSILTGMEMNAFVPPISQFPCLRSVPS